MGGLPSRRVIEMKGSRVGVEGCVGCFGHEMATERGDEGRGGVRCGSRKSLLDLEISLAEDKIEE
jgi:hypothetical protein